MINLRSRMSVLAGVLVLAGSSSAAASPLVYTPVNPNFGGSPLNGPFLLGEANVNNQFLTNPATRNATNPANSPQQAIKNFQDAVTNALLGQVASQIASDILGPHAMQSGQFNIGGELITFQQSNGVVTVNLTDPTTGGVTTLQIPVPTF
jgi:curli production assembly/transport component CsgF